MKITKDERVMRERWIERKENRFSFISKDIQPFPQLNTAKKPHKTAYLQKLTKSDQVPSEHLLFYPGSLDISQMYI